MANEQMANPERGPKTWLKRLGARALRPAIEPYARAGHERADALERRLARAEELLEGAAGTTVDREKHREERAYWRWLIKSEAGRKSLYAPFEVAFGAWQRERVRELGAALGLAGD